MECLVPNLKLALVFPETDLPWELRHESLLPWLHTREELYVPKGRLHPHCLSRTNWLGQRLVGVRRLQQNGERPGVWTARGCGHPRPPDLLHHRLLHLRPRGDQPMVGDVSREPLASTMFTSFITSPFLKGCFPWFLGTLGNRMNVRPVHALCPCGNGSYMVMGTLIVICVALCTIVSNAALNI